MKEKVNRSADRPWRGAEFDPDDQGPGHPTTDAPSETPVVADRVDGQTEGLFAAALGNESVMLDSDSAAGEYLERDAEEARARVLATERSQDSAVAAVDLAAAVDEAGD